MTGREYLTSTARSMKLDITVPYQDILAEAKKLREFFIPYQQGNDYRHSGWYSLPLHGLGDDKTLAWRGYGYTDGFSAAKDMHWTSWADRCPATVQWLKETFPSQAYGRVRFMLLTAGGFIAPHCDGPDSYLEAVNVALNNPTNCNWYWKDGTTIDFAEGNAVAVNISYEHEVRNNSNEDRYHMIIHHYDSTEEWKELMTRSMERENVQGNFLYRPELY
jgi:Aspartyl/Asparaginyl beta-hydroxylase